MLHQIAAEPVEGSALRGFEGGKVGGHGCIHKGKEHRVCGIKNQCLPKMMSK